MTIGQEVDAIEHGENGRTWLMDHANDSPTASGPTWPPFHMPRIGHIRVGIGLTVLPSRTAH